VTTGATGIEQGRAHPAVSRTALRNRGTGDEEDEREDAESWPEHVCVMRLDPELYRGCALVDAPGTRSGLHGRRRRRIPPTINPTPQWNIMIRQPTVATLTEAEANAMC
jgi:hypothetical protein